MMRLVTIQTWVAATFGVLLTMQREIFDENAYVRFLERNGAERSRASYAQFLREMTGRKERTVRCC